jgi:hypothetical protein
MFLSTSMIPCEFCNEVIPMNRIYNHTMVCPQFRSSPYARHLATVALSDPGAVNRRFLLSDMFAILCRNELLDARDEDEQEEQAHSQFDHYDEIDERVDVVRHVRRQTSRAFRLAMPSPSSNMLIPIRQMQIVPYSPPPPARTSYDENLALADRFGRVVIGVKNIKAILQPSPSDDPTLCPICQDMCSASDAVTTRHCNHAFCEPCITRWFRQSKYCPVCKHCFDDA